MSMPDISAASLTSSAALAEPHFMGLNEVQAVLLTGLFAVVVAVWTVFSQRGIAARQATLEFLRRSEADHDLIAAKRIFNELAARPEGLAPYAHRTAWKTDQSRAIRMVLNECEMIAVAIERGILDDVVHRRWMSSGFISYWDRAAPYVLILRQLTSNEALYYEFEQMVRWYKGGPNMPQRWFALRKFT